MKQLAFLRAIVDDQSRSLEDREDAQLLLRVFSPEPLAPERAVEESEKSYETGMDRVREQLSKFYRQEAKRDE